MNRLRTELRRLGLGEKVDAAKTDAELESLTVSVLQAMANAYTAVQKKLDHEFSDNVTKYVSEGPQGFTVEDTRA
jgi:hypothetical protein